MATSVPAGRRRAGPHGALASISANLRAPCRTEMAASAGTHSTSQQGALQPELRHVVLFRFMPTATQQQKDALVEAFAALPAEIPTIRYASLTNTCSLATHLLI